MAWQSGLMRVTRNHILSGAQVRILVSSVAPTRCLQVSFSFLLQLPLCGYATQVYVCIRTVSMYPWYEGACASSTVFYKTMPESNVSFVNPLFNVTWSLRRFCTVERTNPYVYSFLQSEGKPFFAHIIGSPPLFPLKVIAFDLRRAFIPARASETYHNTNFARSYSPYICVAWRLTHARAFPPSSNEVKPIHVHSAPACPRAPSSVMPDDYYYQPVYRTPPFPKIAAILGASTDVGQSLLRELLDSPEIEKVHAIATNDIPLLSRLSSSQLRKARVHLVPFQDLDKAFRRISECDIAFCVSISERHAYDQIGHAKFRLINRTGPLRFIDQMFELGVVHFSLLSHYHADSSSRSEFYKNRGEVEDYLRSIRQDAGDYAPYISTFKISTPVSNAISTRSTRDHLKSKVSESDSRSQQIEVKEVARAMEIDAYAKAAASRPPGSRKKRTANEKFYAPDILRMLRSARDESNYRY